MEFKIKVDEMQSVISRLMHVIKVNNDDVFGMMLIDVSDSVVFKAVSSDVTMIINAEDCEVIKRGRALLRFREVKGYLMRFYQLVDDHGTENFHFVVDKKGGLIKSKTQFADTKPSYKRLKFEVFSTDMFPVTKTFDEPQLIVNSSILKRGISRVLHCVNPQEVRRAFTGLSITIKDDKIVFAGTNGVKLVEFEVELTADIERPSDILSYAFATVLRNVLDEDAQVFMKFEGRHLYIKSNNVYIIGGLIFGESYPDYKPMFSLDKQVKFPRLSFIDAVNSAMDVLDAEDNNRLTLNFTSDTLTIKNDVSEAVQKMDANFDTELDVDVNGVFLESLMKDFVGEDLQIDFKEGNKYLVFRSPDNPSHTALLTIVKRR